MESNQSYLEKFPERTLKEKVKNLLASKRRIRRRLAKWTPDFIKPRLRPLYYHWQNLTTYRKSYDELHQYWKKPYDGHNLPQDYIEGHERSQFLVELIRRYVKTNVCILEIGCNVGRNLNYLFNAGYAKLGGWRLAKMLSS